MKVVPLTSRQGAEELKISAVSGLQKDCWQGRCESEICRLPQHRMLPRLDIPAYLCVQLRAKVLSSARPWRRAEAGRAVLRPGCETDRLSCKEVVLRVPSAWQASTPKNAAVSRHLHSLLLSHTRGISPLQGRRWVLSLERPSGGRI